MKNTIWLFLLSSGLLTGCNENQHNEPTEISAAEKEITQKEITGRLQEIIEGCKKVDLEAALKPYSTDFTIVNPDASINNYNEMKSIQADFFKSAVRINFITAKQDFKFLSKDLVMCIWSGTDEYELKTGERYKISPYTGSMLFSKTGNEWKIIYAHESAGNPVKQ